MVTSVVEALNLVTEESVPPVERLAPAVSVRVKVPVPVMVPFRVVVAPLLTVRVRPEFMVRVLEASTVSVPVVPSPTEKSEVVMIVSLEIVKLFTDWPLPVSVWTLTPFKTSVAFEPVIAPSVKVMLPPTLQVPLPKEIEGTPAAALEKLIEPVIFTAGLLATAVTVRSPEELVMGLKLPKKVIVCEAAVPSMALKLEAVLL